MTDSPTPSGGRGDAPHLDDDALSALLDGSAADTADTATAFGDIANVGDIAGPEHLGECTICGARLERLRQVAGLVAIPARLDDGARESAIAAALAVFDSDRRPSDEGTDAGPEGDVILLAPAVTQRPAARFRRTWLAAAAAVLVIGVAAASATLGTKGGEHSLSASTASTTAATGSRGGNAATVEASGNDVAGGVANKGRVGVNGLGEFSDPAELARLLPGLVGDIGSKPVTQSSESPGGHPMTTADAKVTGTTTDFSSDPGAGSYSTSDNAANASPSGPGSECAELATAAALDPLDGDPPGTPTASGPVTTLLTSSLTWQGRLATVFGFNLEDGSRRFVVTSEERCEVLARGRF